MSDILVKVSKNSAIIVGAGSSRRMDGEDKVFVRLLNRPTIAWTIQTFEKTDKIDQIVLVLSKDNIDLGKKLVENEGWKKISYICEGGERRQDSVEIGLNLLRNSRIVMIHDAARPCITSDIIERGLSAVQSTGAAVAAIKAVDTIKRVGTNYEIIETIVRDNLWVVQTPQVFNYDLILKAHKHVKENVTDDATMVEKLGWRVVVYEGSHSNIKITRKADIAYAESFLRQSLRGVS
ncbi:MAG: 2-C-methyl-D-erythritol 4-phosphate cytidylyltransferase [Candidatus Micrarchaeaceae archaeon]